MFVTSASTTTVEHVAPMLAGALRRLPFGMGDGLAAALLGQPAPVVAPSGNGAAGPSGPSAGPPGAYASPAAAPRGGAAGGQQQQQGMSAKEVRRGIQSILEGSSSMANQVQKGGDLALLW